MRKKLITIIYSIVISFHFSIKTAHFLCERLTEEDRRASYSWVLFLHELGPAIRAAVWGYGVPPFPRVSLRLTVCVFGSFNTTWQVMLAWLALLPPFYQSLFTSAFLMHMSFEVIMVTIECLSLRVCDCHLICLQGIVEKVEDLRFLCCLCWDPWKQLWMWLQKWPQSKGTCWIDAFADMKSSRTYPICNKPTQQPGKTYFICCVVKNRVMLLFS